MENKIRIKWGDVEVEYEGSEAFLKKELQAILEAVAKLHGGAPPSSGGSGGLRRNVLAGKALSSTSDYGARNGATTCGKLILAAAAKLTFTDKQESFSRDELLKEMKSAKAYYKASHRKNLTAYLKSLVLSQKLNDQGNDTYALSPAVVNEWEKLLGES